MNEWKMNNNINQLNSPKVSVIVPIYNSQDYLAECIDSILNQTLKNIQILCVNDGSTDNSGKILADYKEKDKRISVITKSNGGLSSARNEGMKFAIGEYIGFVDSDDVIDEMFFEQLYQTAKINNADIAVSNFKWFSHHINDTTEISWITTALNKIQGDLITSSEDRKKVIETCSVCNKLFLSSFLNHHNFLFYEGLFWEDNPFTVMTVIMSNKVSIIRDVYYHCRKHEKSITGRAVSDKKPFDMFEIMAKLKVFFIKENIQNKEGYKFYYEEVLYVHHFTQLFERVHKNYRKEYYKLVKTELNKLSEECVVHLKKKFNSFIIIKNYNYFIFLIAYYYKKYRINLSF